MGFDGDLVQFEVENVFGISVLNRDVERLHTLGDLHEYVVNQIGAWPSCPGETCITAHAFYAARKILVDQLELRRKRLRPDTQVHRLLPVDTRLRQITWRQLELAMGTSLPGLEFSSLITTTLVLFSLTMIGSAIGAVCYRTPSVALHLQLIGLAVAFGVAAIAVPLLATWLARDFRSTVPRECRTIGGLSSFLLCTDPHDIRKPKTRWTSGEVWQVVRAITARNASMKARELYPETKFADLVHPSFLDNIS